MSSFEKIKDFSFKKYPMEVSNMAFCSNCGQQLDDKAKFCPVRSIWIQPAWS